LFYGAESRALACAEAPRPLLSVGRFVAECLLRLLDLAPWHWFRGSSRGRAGKKGSAPSSFTPSPSFSERVAGDDRNNIDYIPSRSSPSGRSNVLVGFREVGAEALV
jgi:hypothetical protein